MSCWEGRGHLSTSIGFPTEKNRNFLDYTPSAISHNSGVTLLFDWGRVGLEVGQVNFIGPSRNLCTKLTYNCDRDPEGQQAISIKDSNWNSGNSNGCILNFGKPGISIEQYMRCVDFIKGERWDQVSSVQLKFKFIRLKENVQI